MLAFPSSLQSRGRCLFQRHAGLDDGTQGIDRYHTGLGVRRRLREGAKKMRKTSVARREDLGLTAAEFRRLSRLDSPEKIQKFLCSIPCNFEPNGDTCLSVRQVLQQRRAHCIEGAFVAACALWIRGEPPLLFDLKAENDHDHVVALFRRNGCWGAISKTNPPVLRWRDPVYRSLRELAMSYFHEYANRHFRKTLRSYAGPFDLRRIDPGIWVTNGEDCWDVGNKLEQLRHIPLISRRQAKALLPRDAIERRVASIQQYREPKKRG
jgi:hypothetical protein